MLVNGNNIPWPKREGALGKEITQLHGGPAVDDGDMEGLDFLTARSNLPELQLVVAHLPTNVLP